MVFPSEDTIEMMLMIGFPFIITVTLLRWALARFTDIVIPGISAMGNGVPSHGMLTPAAPPCIMGLPSACSPVTVRRTFSPSALNTTIMLFGAGPGVYLDFATF